MQLETQIAVVEAMNSLNRELETLQYALKEREAMVEKQRRLKDALAGLQCLLDLKEAVL